MIESPPAPRRGASITGQDETLKVAEGGHAIRKLRDTPFVDHNRIAGLSAPSDFVLRRAVGLPEGGRPRRGGRGFTGLSGIRSPPPPRDFAFQGGQLRGGTLAESVCGAFYNYRKGYFARYLHGGSVAEKKPGAPATQFGFFAPGRQLRRYSPPRSRVFQVEPGRGRWGERGVLREMQKCDERYVPCRIFPSAASPFSVDLTGLRSPAVAG